MLTWSAGSLARLCPAMPFRAPHADQQKCTMHRKPLLYTHRHRLLGLQCVTRYSNSNQQEQRSFIAPARPQRPSRLRNTSPAPPVPGGNTQYWQQQEQPNTFTPPSPSSPAAQPPYEEQQPSARTQLRRPAPAPLPVSRQEALRLQQQRFFQRDGANSPGPQGPPPASVGGYDAPYSDSFRAGNGNGSSMNGRDMQPSSAAGPSVSQQQQQQQQQGPQMGFRGQDRGREGAGASSVALLAPPPRRSARPGEVLLQRTDLIDKQVITRTGGDSLGKVVDLLVDPASLAVVALQLGSGLLNRDNEEYILLKSLRQVGDVILVHDRAVLREGAGIYPENFCRLWQAKVCTHDNVEMGKVRDFAFSPDTGAVSSMQYDALGNPAIPASWFTVWELPVSCVEFVTGSSVILRRGAERSILRVSTGKLDLLVEAVVALLRTAGLRDEEPEDSVEGVMTPDEWKRVYGEQWRQYYGEDPDVALGRIYGGSTSAVSRRLTPAPRKRVTLAWDSPGYMAGPGTTPAAARDPRTRTEPAGPSGYGMAPPSQRALPAQRQAVAGTASVPIIDRSRDPAFRRRDVDGNFGERGSPEQRGRQEPSDGVLRSFDEWVVDAPQQRSRVPALEVSRAGESRGVPGGGPWDAPPPAPGSQDMQQGAWPPR